MTILKVKVVGGVRVPYQHNARKYIEGDEAVTVQNTAYYLRQIAAGDLTVITDKAEAAKHDDTPVTDIAVASEPKTKTKVEASRGQF